MRKQRLIPLIVLLVGIVALMAWNSVYRSEPLYKGKELSEWLALYQSTQLRPQAAEAIQHVGTNALPKLLDLLQTRDSPIKHRLDNFLKNHPGFRFQPRTAEDDWMLAYYGFEALGTTGAPAVPTLTNLLADHELRTGAAACLGAIGPPAKDAVPLLIPWLTSTNLSLRFSAAHALGLIGPASADAVPILVTWLTNTTPGLNFFAAQTFADLGPAAAQAKPALLNALRATNSLTVRNEIELALSKQQADPEMLVPLLTKEIQEEWNSGTGTFPSTRIEALSEYGSTAKPAMPILLELLAHERSHIVRRSPDESGKRNAMEKAGRETLEKAIKQIDPEAAAQAGIR
jgi:HEAT repeat protein